ncbi:GNAT family N-acetyltransferase [Streptomyces sp. NPDC058953]|uniref:GNAT family N-acetyltransferase n=1 Tax=unclassified Streptomyces TaxID=2593676 RepID=UPI0036B98678
MSSPELPALPPFPASGAEQRPLRVTTSAAAPGDDRLTLVASDRDGVPRGTASLRLFPDPGRRALAELRIDVEPADRRRGVGTRLLDEALAAAREDGRRSVLAGADAESPGAGFLAARGFRTVLTLLHARLALADADPDALARIVADAPTGYRLTSWSGTVPDALAATFTAARRAMDDMPTEDADLGTVVWDEERVREVARRVEERGDLLHTVAAVDVTGGSAGSVIGFTELVFPCDGGDGIHYGTAVLPDHRGRGLALRMKAESILHARGHAPGRAGLVTDTAAANGAMRRVNERLGYRFTHTSWQFQRELEGYGPGGSGGPGRGPGGGRTAA